MRAVSPFEAVRYGEHPSPGDEDAAADVSAGLALQGALPRPAPGPAGPAAQDPLAHAGGGAAAALCGNSSAPSGGSASSTARGKAGHGALPAALQ